MTFNRYPALATLAILILSVHTSLSQIPHFTITMAKKDYEQLYSRDQFSDEFLPATVEYGGTTWRDAKIRFKGKSNRYFPKKPFRIKFPSKQPFDGMHQINLHAMYNDKSFIREKLAWDLFDEMEMLAPRAEYATLTINGNPKGLYLRVDRVDKFFLKKRGQPIEKASLYNTDAFYSLADLTEQPQELLRLYYPKEVGDTNDYGDLQNLIHALNTVSDSSFAQLADSVFDVGTLYNWLAGNLLTQMGDSYNKNYFLYRDPRRLSHSWEIIPWDYDVCFGLSGDLAVPYPNSLLNDGFTYSFEVLSGPESVLRNRLLRSPALMDGFRKRIDTLLHTIFTEEHLFPRIDSLVALIKDNVAADSGKWGTYWDFLESVETVKHFITARRNFLLRTFINQPTGDYNIATVSIDRIGVPYHFVGVDGRTVATMWFSRINGLDSVTVFAHADSIPPCLAGSADTARSVHRWIEVTSYPETATFTARMRWEYRDVASTDREVGNRVKDERTLVVFCWNGTKRITCPAKINPFANTVTIDSITANECGGGRFFFAMVP